MTNDKSRCIEIYDMIPLFGPVPGGMEIAVIAMLLAII